MSREVQSTREFRTHARLFPHAVALRTSASIAWRSCLSRPTNKGLLLSCLFHALLCFALTFVAWAAPRSADNLGPVMAITQQQPGRNFVEFEISPADLTGGGGGPTPSPEEFEFVNAPLALDSGAGPAITVRLPALEKPIAGLNPGPGLGRGRGTGHGDGTGSRKLAGKNAVTEGSFTVWTDPDDPIPGETYTIMIEVRLPENVTHYPRKDLAGLVTGTDGWEQPLPGNAKPVQQYLPIHNHTVQLEVDVPGAGRRVRDTIQLRSKLLKEEQVLKIVF